MTASTVGMQLGLFGFDLGEDGTLLGFTGGTLGTSTATFLHVETGRIISTAITMTNLEVSGASGLGDALSLLSEDLAWSHDIDNGPIVVQGVSAAELDITGTSDGFMIAAQGAQLEVGTSLASFDPSDMVFQDGSVLLTGSAGHNRLVLGREDAAFAMDNQLIGLAGHDILKAGFGNDKLIGGTGHDRLHGRGGDDSLDGGAGHDRLFGGVGDDTLDGGAGHDRLKGQEGDDVLNGAAGHDRLWGGAGADVLVGGAGHDVMIGGSGADVFVFAAATENGRREFDRVKDFDVTDDMLAIQGASVDTITETQSGVLITLDGDGDCLMLQGVTDADALIFI